MKKIFLIISILALSNNSLAGVWYSNVTIEYVYAGDVGDRVAVKIEDLSDIGGCGSSEMVFKDITSPYFESMFSVILSARMSKNTISLFSDGTCTSGGATLNDVRLWDYNET